MTTQPSVFNKKMVLAFGLILAIGAYVLWARTTNPGSAVSTMPATTPDLTSIPPVAVGLKNGTFTGTTANKIYGPVQVRAVIEGGRLVDVLFIQYPNDRKTSTQISNNAMPIMKQEAIAKQSAKVNNVSGATQTVKGFTESLTAALALASA